MPRSAHGPGLRPLLVLLALLLGALGPVAADDPPKPGEPGFDPTRIPTPEVGRASLYAEVSLQPTGDVDVRIEVHFHPDVYAKVRESTPDPAKFLQDMRPNRADYEVAPGAKAGFDDQAHAVILLMRELGGVRGLGEGRWALPIAPSYTLLGSDVVDGRPRAFFEERGTWDSGMEFAGRYVYLLPAGAEQSNWDADEHLLTYTLAPAAPTGPARLHVNTKAKDRLMASVYKVYGLGQNLSGQWVAKTVLRNTGGAPLTNLRVRYRLGAYSEWSGWNKFPQVVPGQTVVSVYYPVLDASIARLRTNTPVDLRVEWSYVDGEGRKQEDDDTTRIVVLGINEFVFSNLVAGESFGTWHEQFNNAPLLAAWVSRNDLVVKQLAAMANRLAGGVAAGESDENAGRVLAACYELLRRNDFTYQHPPALADKTIAFDVRQVQNVKFPRETIRDRSGTCIDLAILYAALLNAVGLEPHLALVPGHCFPVIKTGAGTIVGVEVTGLGGGLRGHSAEFLEVLEKGTQELKEASEDGRLYLVNVRDLWTRGVANPELDELPADILERWNIREEGRGQPGTQPPAPRGDNPLLGVWEGEMSERLQNGKTITYPVRIGIDPADGGTFELVFRADVTLPQDDGSELKRVLLEYATGRLQGQDYVFRATRRTITDPATSETREVETQDQTIVRVEGGRLVGRTGNDKSGYSRISFARAAQPGGASQGPDPLVGIWRGELSERIQGRLVTYPVRVGIDAADGGRFTMVFRADVTLPDGQGGEMKRVMLEYAEGGREGKEYVFTANRRTITDPATDETREVDTQDQTIVHVEGGRLVGRTGNDKTGWTRFSFEREPSR